jgi:hypothetical protein
MLFSIRQLITPRLEKRFGQAVSIGDHRLAKLRPVALRRHVNALNKTGRLVLYGEEDGQALKIYEAASAEHACFIKTACSHQHLRGAFPPVRTVQDRFLIVAWLENLAKGFPPVKALARLLHRIHQTPIAELPPSGFDYWHHLLKPRFARIAELLGANAFAKEVIACVNTAWDRSPRFLMHPDITPANMVLAQKGAWVAIDNELMTIGGLPLLDLCNTAHALQSSVLPEFVAAYFSEATTRVSQEDIDSLNAAWLARRLGAEFVAGNLDKAQRILSDYRDGHDILPIVLSA